MKQEMILGKMNMFPFWSFFFLLKMALLTQPGNVLWSQCCFLTYVFCNYIFLWLFQPVTHKSSFTVNQFFIPEHFQRTETLCLLSYIEHCPLSIYTYEENLEPRIKTLAPGLIKIQVQTASVKDQIVHLLGFASPGASCYVSVGESSPGGAEMNELRLHSGELRKGAGRAWPPGCSLPIQPLL